MFDIYFIFLRHYNIMIKLKPHQIIPINFLKKNRGLILYHSTGSGKTLTSIYAMYQFDNDIIILGPKSSRKSFVDNINKAKISINKFSFYSFKKIKNLLEKNLNIFRNKSVIIDEAHNLRSETHNNLSLIKALSSAFKIILLSATPVVNYPNDLAVLINIVKNKEILPTNRKLFNRLYYDEDNFIILNEKILSDKLKNCISYYKQKDDENFPTYNINIEEVVMNKQQLEKYTHYVNKFVYKDEKNKNIYYVDFSTLEKKNRNFFLHATRQISNTINSQSDTPKIISIFKKIKNGPFPIIIYSNFLKNGIYAIMPLLEKNNITYNAITGETTQDKISEIANEYNNGKFKVLLISSAGSESLDLKKTRQIHIMEPHWNESKIIQVIGRAIRYKSHEQLPKKDRNVNIYRWISIFPKNILNESADQYLMRISIKKNDIMNSLLKIIKKSSIEHNLKINNNMKGGGYNEIYYSEYEKLRLEYLLTKKILLYQDPSNFLVKY